MIADDQFASSLLRLMTNQVFEITTDSVTMPETTML
mgnify:CR=1 FL=1